MSLGLFSTIITGDSARGQKHTHTHLHVAFSRRCCLRFDLAPPLLIFLGGETVALLLLPLYCGGSDGRHIV